nr:FIG00761799: membrane protein [uncultured bacterium]
MGTVRSTRSTSTKTSRQLGRRLPQLLVGLVLFGGGIGLTAVSELGIGPWDGLHQGIGDRIDVPLGTVSVAVSFIVLLAWIPLRQRVGIGTILNAVIVGFMIDIVVWALPDVANLAARWALLLGGLVVMGLGSGLYIGAGLGPGARDGLMTGLHRRGVGSLRVIRTTIELTVLAAGWLMGGTVGVGTVLAALAIGPLVQFFLPRLTLPAVLLEPRAEPGR